MYTYMCIRNLRNNRHNEILSNYHSYYKYVYCQAAFKTYPHKKISNYPLNRCSKTNYHKTLLQGHLFPNLNHLNFDTIIVRHLSLTTTLLDKEPLKPSSKVEQTVQSLKDQKKDENQLPTEPPKAKKVVKKSLGQRIWVELVHYYHGFRLLFIDIRVSTGLLWRLLNGKSLTRREHNLLVRTVGDMFRLIPFSIFVIVPFMEFTLPIFLKFFPGMLPSTFQTNSEREDKIKKGLKVKLEMAKFLQKTLDDMAVQHTDRNSTAAKEFTEWFTKVRTSGHQVTNAEIMKFSKLFQDEITLDSLSRRQLIALCRVLEVQTLGTNYLLRFQLRMKLRSLRADDKIIEKEGIDSLNVYELQQACRARGMRAYGMPEDVLRTQLNQWLDLSLNQKVPPSLLLLSRALMLPEKIPTTDKLKATISVLPDAIVTKTKAAIGETEGKIDNKVRYENLKEEVRKMKEEREESREEQKREAKEELKDKAPVLVSKQTEELIDSHTITIKDAATKKKEQQISTKDLGVIEHAIENLALDKKNLILEKEKIEDLKEELADYQEDLQELQVMTADKVVPDIKQSVAAKRLFTKVNKMIHQLDIVVKNLEGKEELLKKEFGGAKSTAAQEEVVRIDELLNAIKKMQKVPNEFVLTQIGKLLGKMDDDHDGSIKVEEVLKIIRVIGKENIQLSQKQLDEVIELMDKEEILEVEDKIEKALQKESLKALAAMPKPKCCIQLKPSPNKTKSAQTPIKIPPTVNADKPIDKPKDKQL